MRLIIPESGVQLGVIELIGRRTSCPAFSSHWSKLVGSAVSNARYA